MEKARYYSVLLADNIFRASIDEVEDREMEKLMGEIWSSERGKTGRMMATLHMVDKVWPGFEDRCKEMFLKSTKLPFKVDRMELIGGGGEQNVLLVESERKRFVAKINRFSQVTEGKEFKEHVERTIKEYKQIRKWYGHLENFIPEEEFVVGHSPVLGLSALITIQPYVEKQMRGVFVDWEEERFGEVLRRNGRLKGVLGEFGKKALEIWESRGKSVDILGERNLAVLGSKINELELYLGDPHVIFDREELRREGSINLERLHNRWGVVERWVRG